jgi:reverse transcriptase-like protein
MAKAPSLRKDWTEGTQRTRKLSTGNALWRLRKWEGTLRGASGSRSKIAGVKPGAVKAASPVLNGGDEETGLCRPRLVATQLECAIYEGDFLGFSYGFRPGRGPHDALNALAVGLVKQKVWWVLDADIQQFYDTLDRHWLRRFLQHRIGDKRLLRLINKWLAIDIIDDGQKTKPTRGIAQGLVIGPLMAHLYLHYVFDLWSHAWRKKRASGDVIITRFADDIVLGFQCQQEAAHFREALELFRNKR